MGEILFDLEQKLRSKQETLTPQEVNVFLKCKAKAIKDFTIGACVGSGVAWLATRRLSKFFRINLSIGAAAISGMWRFGSALDSCVDHVLTLDGSRMQLELARIIVQKYNDPWRMQLISKHFYSEEVFDDWSDRPKIRWRYRNFFSEHAVYNQTHERDFHGDSDSKQPDLESKQLPINRGYDMMGDPFDCVFGYSARGEMSHHPDNSSSTKPRVLNRHHRRSHRRHRMRHQEQEESSNPQQFSTT